MWIVRVTQTVVHIQGHHIQFNVPNQIRRDNYWRVLCAEWRSDTTFIQCQDADGDDRPFKALRANNGWRRRALRFVDHFCFLCSKSNVVTIVYKLVYCFGRSLCKEHQTTMFMFSNYNYHQMSVKFETLHLCGLEKSNQKSTSRAMELCTKHEMF